MAETSSIKHRTTKGRSQNGLRPGRQSGRAANRAGLSAGSAVQAAPIFGGAGLAMFTAGPDAGVRSGSFHVYRGAPPSVASVFASSSRAS